MASNEDTADQRQSKPLRVSKSNMLAELCKLDCWKMKWPSYNQALDSKAKDGKPINLVEVFRWILHCLIKGMDQKGEESNWTKTTNFNSNFGK
uniref:Uncharacterized protein n=1 Tax=Romanomermis culicivorax TaxID=13658 RepID=A0A915L6G4_ROMCU